jgi:hypothetical protein
MTAINLPGQLEVPLVVDHKENDPKAIDIEYFKSIMEISEESPSGLIWTKSRGRAVRGKSAGNIGTGGYYRMSVNDKKYPSHRVIYALHNNVDPGSAHIDHIDGNVQNNTIGNLRLADRSGNCSNSRIRKDNKTGVKGIHIRKRKGRKDSLTCVVISKGVMHKKSFMLGKEAEATEWVRSIREKLHGEFHNHG